MPDVQRNIASLLSEDRVFESSQAFRDRAIVRDRSLYERAEADHEAFWAEQADQLDWFERWDSVMDWTPPWVKWFVGGKLTASYTAWAGTSRPEGARRLPATTLANAEIVEQIHTMVESGSGDE